MVTRYLAHQPQPSSMHCNVNRKPRPGPLTRRPNRADSAFGVNVAASFGVCHFANHVYSLASVHIPDFVDDCRFNSRTCFAKTSFNGRCARELETGRLAC